MALRSRVEGTKRLTEKLRRIPLAQRVAVAKAMGTGAVLIQGDARRLIQRGARSGRIYRRGGVQHQASAPGEPPKTDLGGLAPSIFAELDQDKLGAEVGTNLAYGKHLEFGTTKMAARPWLGRTFEANRERVGKLIADAARQALREFRRR